MSCIFLCSFSCSMSSLTSPAWQSTTCSPNSRGSSEKRRRENPRRNESAFWLRAGGTTGPGLVCASCKVWVKQGSATGLWRIIWQGNCSKRKPKSDQFLRIDSINIFQLKIYRYKWLYNWNMLFLYVMHNFIKRCNTIQCHKKKTYIVTKSSRTGSQLLVKSILSLSSLILVYNMKSSTVSGIKIKRYESLLRSAKRRCYCIRRL